MNKKRVLLTGIGGSISVHFMMHIFHYTDWEIIGTDSFRHKGLTDRVKSVLDEHPDWLDRLTVITHDLTAPFSEMTKRKIGKVDFIISMASLSDVQASIENPTEFIYSNVAIATNLLEYAREAKPEAFIQISTDEVYGASGKGQRHKEWSPIIPSNPYAASKACQEAIAISYWRTYGVPVIITNTMNNFGEMQQTSKFPALLQKKITNNEVVTIHGSPDGDIGTRYYIHSRNFADAVVYILKFLKPAKYSDGAHMPDRYNITGDKQVNNLELAQLIADQMGKKLKYQIEDYHTTRPGHDRHYGLDGEKIRKLGWYSRTTFEESLKNVTDWQQEHPEWLK